MLNFHSVKRNRPKLTHANHIDIFCIELKSYSERDILCWKALGDRANEKVFLFLTKLKTVLKDRRRSSKGKCNEFKFWKIQFFSLVVPLTHLATSECRLNWLKRTPESIPSKPLITTWRV